MLLERFSLSLVFVFCFLFVAFSFFSFFVCWLVDILFFVLVFAFVAVNVFGRICLHSRISSEVAAELRSTGRTLKLIKYIQFDHTLNSSTLVEVAM